MLRHLELGLAIKKVYDWSKGRYGSSRIAKELQMQGQEVSQNLVARIMEKKILEVLESEDLSKLQTGSMLMIL